MRCYMDRKSNIAKIVKAEIEKKLPSPPIDSNNSNTSDILWSPESSPRQT